MIAAYLRVSTANQRDAETISTQRHALARYFEAHGIKPDLQLEDDGVSGGIEIHKRPRGGELYRLVTEGRVHKLYVFALDRIGRDTIDSLLFLRLAESHGTQVIGISDNTDTSREGSTLETEIKAVIAAQYRRDRVRQSKAGLRRRAAGGKVSTRPPFGFAVEDGFLIVDESKAEIIRRAFSEMAQGERTKDIVRRLNEQRAPSPTGAGWRHDTLLYLLKHPAYRGEYPCFITPRRKPGGGHRISRDPAEKIILTCPAIVSREIFDRVQERIAFNRRWSTREGHRFYLLKSVLNCGRCGLAYVGHAIKGRRYKQTVYPDVLYYECGSLSNRDYKPCGGPRVNAAKTERIVWSEIEDFIERPSKAINELVARWNHARRAAVKTSTRERQRIEAGITKNTAARERLIMAVANGVLSDDQARWGLTELDHQAQELRKAAEDLATLDARSDAEGHYLASAETAIGLLREKINHGLTPEKKAQIVRLLVKSAVVESATTGKAAITIEYILPSRNISFGSVGFAFADTAALKETDLTLTATLSV